MARRSGGELKQNKRPTARTARPVGQRARNRQKRTPSECHLHDRSNDRGNTSRCPNTRNIDMVVRQPNGGSDNTNCTNGDQHRNHHLRGLPIIETRVWRSGLNLIWTWEDDNAWYLQQNNALNHIEPSLNIIALSLGSIGLYSGPVPKRGQTLADVLGDAFDQLTDKEFHERVQEADNEGPYPLIFRGTPD